MPPLGANVLPVYYFKLDSTLGCFVNDPVAGPFIMLCSGLGKRSEATVHQHLNDYYRGLPGDSPYLLFRHVVCYEDLVPPEALPVAAEAWEEEIQIILIGRAGRRWQFAYPVGEEARVIGRAG